MGTKVPAFLANRGAREAQKEAGIDKLINENRKKKYEDLIDKFLEKCEEKKYRETFLELAQELENLAAETDFQNKEVAAVWTFLENKVAENKAKQQTPEEKMLWDVVLFNPVWSLFTARHEKRVHEMRFREEIERMKKDGE